MATTRQRYMISVDDALFEEIENFRFERRFQTRSEATAELIRLGVESLREHKKTPDNVRVFRAASSESNTEPQIIDVPRSTIDKLKTAKPVDEI